MLDKSQLSEGIDADNISAQEIARFDQMAQEWWQEDGKYAAAIAFNQARFDYIKSQICTQFKRLPSANRPLTDIRILDLGCGGGLLSEPLAQLGAKVTGIDASAVSIQVAKRHARQTGVAINYQHCLAEQLVANNSQFDVVINAEVLEHVPIPSQLVKQCSQLTRPGGMVILATLNRTLISWMFAIVGAEYILGLLPRGTHSWSAFIKPTELHLMASDAELKLVQQTGLAYNPVAKRWRLSDFKPINYIACYNKRNIL